MFALVTSEAVAGAQNTLDLAQTLYYQGVAGDKTATKESINLLETLVKEQPENALAQAYLGSNYLVESGRTFAPWKKYSLAKSGIIGLDQAVAQAPEHLEVRFVRAMSTWHLPSIFHREEQCQSDFAWLAERVRRAAEAGTFDRKLAAATFYHYGLLQEKKGNKTEAMRLWKEAVSVAPESSAGRKSAEKLK